MLEAVIFDMDGVLIDSEYTYLKSKTSILKDEGFFKPISYQYQFMGTTYEFMWSTMKKELGLTQDVGYYIEEMNKRRREMIRRDGIREIKGAVSLVHRIYQMGLALAVASSSPKEEISQAMSSLGILEYFDKLISGEEVENSKPAPDVYIEAARQLHVSPEKCLAVEDTRNGSLSAQRAGMFVIGFANPDYPPQDLSASNIIVSNYEEITSAYINALS